MQELPHPDNETPNLATKLICLIITVMWVGGILFPSVILHYFALAPGNIFSGPLSHIWTLFTAGYVEPDFATGLINICVFALIAPFLERCYGSSLFIRFIIHVNFIVYVAFFVIMIVFCAMTGADSSLYKAESGFSGINAALIVGLKQQYANKPIFPWKVPFMLTFKQLPFAVVCFTFTSMMLGVKSNQFILIILGTFLGWIYLRFFMLDPVTLIAGDSRNEFSYASFFPVKLGLHHVCEIIGDGFSFLCFPAQNSNRNSSNNSNNISYDHLHNQDTSDSLAVISLQNKDPSIEKRRQAAIKAIDEKLAALQRHEGGGLGGGSSTGQDDVNIDIDYSELDIGDVNLDDTDINLEGIDLGDDDLAIDLDKNPSPQVNNVDVNSNDVNVNEDQTKTPSNPTLTSPAVSAATHEPSTNDSNDQ